jgi:hypothetical protein
VCERWDDDNWKCSMDGVGGERLVSMSMKDGKLTWFYWGQTRDMTPHHRLWNKPTPF